MAKKGKLNVILYLKSIYTFHLHYENKLQIVFHKVQETFNLSLNSKVPSGQ